MDLAAVDCGRSDSRMLSRAAKHMGFKQGDLSSRREIG
jgi:hypothetical protein